MMLDYKTIIEKRQCETCSDTYEEEVIWMDGKETFAGAPNICEKCSQSARDRVAREKRIEHTKMKFEALIPHSMRLTNVNHESFNTKLHRHTQAWLKSEIKNNGNGWLGIIGETGKCKTRCIALLVKSLLWEGRKVQWCKAKRFQEAAQNTWSSGSETLRELARESRQHLELWKKVDVLVIDDIGKNRFTDNVESELFDLLDERSETGRMTIWSANTHPNEMMKRFNLSEDRGKPLIGRLIDFSEIVNV